MAGAGHATLLHLPYHIPYRTTHRAMKTTANRRVRQGGFTLIEIMVVIVILGLLATIVAPNVFSVSETAKEKKAMADVKAIYEAARMYMLTHSGSAQRDVPTMETLTTPDEKGVAQIEMSSKDPWGNDYEIHAGDRPGKFEVVSAGKDGQMGTEDDISSAKLGDAKQH
jgi:general secretion pathway protein G